MTTWDYPRIIAHRCGGALAPENTLAGLRLAVRLGVRAVEFDAMLARDGVPVLIHDETLDRTVLATGLVADNDSTTLAGLDAGGRHHRAFTGESLPTLAQALMLCDELGLAVNLEIKPAFGKEQETGLAVAAFAAVSAPKAGLIVSSFSSLALLAAKDIAPELPRALLVKDVPDDWQGQLAAHGCIAIHAAGDRLTAEKAAAIVAAKVPLACYTVNSTAQANALFALGVRSIFTDRPDLF